MQTIGLVLLSAGIIASIKERRYLMMWRSRTVSSPLATTVTHWVGTAGGIYLALELLFSFLKLPEEWWSSSTFVVEPLATLSLVLAIIQPFALRLLLKLRK